MLGVRARMLATMGLYVNGSSPWGVHTLTLSQLPACCMVPLFRAGGKVMCPWPVTPAKRHATATSRRAIVLAERAL